MQSCSLQRIWENNLMSSQRMLRPDMRRRVCTSAADVDLTKAVDVGLVPAQIKQVVSAIRAGGHSF